MGKFLVRISIIVTSLYFLLSCIIAQFEGVDILSDWYSLLFELIAVVYCYSEGKYHCEHIRHLSLALLLSDALARLDNCYHFLTVYAHNMLTVLILSIGFLLSIASAFRHFYQVNKLKRKKKSYEYKIKRD